MTYKPGDEVVLKAGVPDHLRGWRASLSNGSGDDWWFRAGTKSLAGRRYPDREIRALLETLSEPSAADQPPATSP